MARKNYTDEFRWRAVDLYESTPGATLKGIAADLGISRGALKEWVGKLGSGVVAVGASTASTASTVGRPESQSARIVRLETELSASQSEKRKLETERDILRQAAKYFAGETNW
jgi:transposase